MAVVVVAIVVILIATGGGSKTGIPKTTQAKNQTVTEVNSLVGGIPQSGNVLGNPNAPVTLQYFGDLECPICKEFTLASLPSIIQNWVRTGKLKIEYRSMETATREPEVFKLQQVAALAAGKQNKMWDFLELFYHEQGEEDSRLRHRKLPPGTCAAGPRANLAQVDERPQRTGAGQRGDSRRAGGQQRRLHGHAVVPDRQDRRHVADVRTGHVHRTRRPTTRRSKSC